jgi:ParB family transcriptional regulator, chromosome partitioning protein
METTVINAIEYRDLPLDWLHVSPTNPRKSFDEEAMHQLAASIDANGVLQPLLVRPRGERHFEIVFGERRYRGAKLTARATVPVCIRQMTDAEVLEAQLVENLQRAEVHPMEEAQGFKALLDLEEPKYTVELIAAKVGKTPAYIAQRLKLIDLTPPVIEAFYSNDIGVGHALLLAKLPSDRQEMALAACFKEDWSTSIKGKAKSILLPVRSLQFWIEHNVLLFLKDAPFDKRDPLLVEAAGSCVDCPRRTGHNKLLFSDLSKQDACTAPSCYRAKVDAHIAKQIATRPQLVQISTAYGKPAEASNVLLRNQYTAIRNEKPKTKDEAALPEFKVCKFATDAIITEGRDIGSVQKVCPNPDCPVHHPKVQTSRHDAKAKPEQEKQRIETAIANTTGIRVLTAIGEAVPVRLMKRDLLFVAEGLFNVFDENRVTVLAKQHGIKKNNDTDSVLKLFGAFLRRANEGTLGRVLVESIILQSASRGNPNTVLKDAASFYKIDTDAIAATVKQEFAAKAKAKAAKQATGKAPTKQQTKAVKEKTAA